MDRNEIIRLISNESLLFFPAIKDIISTNEKNIERPKFSPLQYLTLSFIGIENKKNNNVGINMKTISDFIGVSKQQCSKLVDELYKENCITRELNINNRREILVKLTKDGFDEIHKAQEIRIHNLTLKCSHLTDEELTNLYYHLHEIKVLINK